MAQYFEANPELDRKFRRLSLYLNGREFTFETCSGVYSKDAIDEYSLMLVNGTVSYRVSGRVLDLGCGYGVIGIILKSRYPEIELTLSDVNAAAVELTRANLQLNAVTGTAVCSDGFEKLTGEFDLVVLNPPIHAGKAVVYRLFSETFEHLREGGRLVLVMQKKHGAESALRELRGGFKDAVTLYRNNGIYILECSK
jgi:16S rRNA (guanine1207-N2)-methyltransferase